MLFTSLEFLLLFLPLCLAAYYILPSRFGLRNYWLLAASLAFYAWGEPWFVFVMLGSIAFNYVVALAMDRARAHGWWAKALLWLAVVGNLSVIGVWKYANFITTNLREWIPLWNGFIPQTSFILPIGISFFTFQAMSYVIDVHRGTVKAQRNPFFLALYIALFPQLIAGPIVRYSTVCGEIMRRHETLDDFSSGVWRFLCGFSKKMLLANAFAEVADKAFGMQAPGAAMAWLGAVSYTFQIFFDFSGYSDMAIGLGRMFGFHFEENFNYPYVSKSVTEFWRRWHISLGSWFRDYVYFPLGGSRVGKMRLVFNLAVVWALTGLWHGANWTFILWGALYGVLIMVEKLCGIPKKIDMSPFWRAAWQPLTLLAVVLGWVLFRSPDIFHAMDYMKSMFGFGAVAMNTDVALFELGEIKVLLGAALLLSTPFFSMLKARSGATIQGGGYALVEGLVLLTLFAVSVSCLAMNAHNPFIYFNF